MLLALVGDEGRIGVFALAGLGMYLSSDFWLQGYGVSGDVREKTLHMTAMIGVRAYLSRLP